MITHAKSKLKWAAVVAAFFVALIWGVNAGVICATTHESQTCTTTQGEN